MSRTDLLTIEHLVKKAYGENTVLDDVSLSVQPRRGHRGGRPSAAAARARCLRCINALEPIQSEAPSTSDGNEPSPAPAKDLTESSPENRHGVPELRAVPAS